jgi:transcription initiation factor TFIIIB Brf1 subunit/transcription initiation factor TFIIB
VTITLEGEEEAQKDVAEATRVTEVTFRNRYIGLKEALRI